MSGGNYLCVSPEKLEEYNYIFSFIIADKQSWSVEGKNPVYNTVSMSLPPSNFLQIYKIMCPRSMLQRACRIKTKARKICSYNTSNLKPIRLNMNK
jgi:hypothetical protein